MITGKLALGIVSFLLSLTAIVLGFWSYSISLRSSIRMKYYNNHSSDREQMIQRECKEKLGKAILLFSHLRHFDGFTGLPGYLADKK